MTQPLLTAGAPLSSARLAIILLHGRGGSPHDMLALAAELSLMDCAFLAPQAPGYTWYPYSFLAPIPQNEPFLSASLDRVTAIVTSLESEGFSPARIALLGFSQGACLALEWSARHPARYAAIAGFSGGLIGPPGTQWHTPGSFGSAPVFLGCSDVDPHIPVERVHETSTHFIHHGAAVTERIYPGLPHTVNADEIQFTRSLLSPQEKPRKVVDEFSGSP